MAGERFFLDSFFALALVNATDDYHAQARALFSSLRLASEVWVTEAVLTEIGNGLSRAADSRNKATAFIESCYKLPNFRVLAVDAELFQQALSTYKKFDDKEWGLTDCISFVVMRREGLADALTADHHFEQAGFTLVFTTSA